MYDNPLIILLRGIIVAGFAARNLPAYAVKQSQQPVQQGVDSAPTIYFQQVSDQRYGFLKFDDVWDAQSGEFVHCEAQWHRTTFQVNALAIQDPASQTQYTAKDILNFCANTLQCAVGLKALAAAKVGIERVTQIRVPYFIDDKGRHEASPSFDVTFTHLQRELSVTPMVNRIVGTVAPVLDPFTPYPGAPVLLLEDGDILGLENGGLMLLEGE